MTKLDFLFGVSTALAVLSFVLFAFQIAFPLLKLPKPKPGPDGKLALTIDIGEILKQLAALAESFGKAGPLATTAVLTIAFIAVSLITSGYAFTK